jgi:chaperonin cofactor prefoldin
MCGCGGCGHGHGHCRDWDYAHGPYGGYGRSFMPSRGSSDEVIDDLQEYKESLEAEIRRLEKRIGSLHGKATSE